MQLFPQNSPSGRYGHAVAYDAAHGQIVLFGGANPQRSQVFNDTWIWDGANWMQDFPQGVPPAQLYPAMAYDAARSQVVMFGGLLDGVQLPDTWVWDGNNWIQRFPQTSPSARSGHAMVYDSTHDQIVLFGGFDGASYLNDTWVWDGTNWSEKSPTTMPPARIGCAMAYDSARGHVLIFGGNNSTTLNDTWAWDGSNWTRESPQTSPAPRASPIMTYDTEHDQVVLFGGYTSGTAFNDTWTWQGGPIPAPTVSNVLSASSFGGFSSAAPGSWIEIYGSNLAPDTRSWESGDFSGDNAPTSLDHVSVSISGQAAFVDYISPTQVNAQLPSNVSTGGPLALTVTNSNGASTAFSLPVNTTEPGLLAPAQFKIGANQYVVAVLADGTYALPTGAIAGVNSRPAKPGETIVMYGVGFGAVSPDIPAGEIVTQSNQLQTNLQILFGLTQADFTYAGLAPNLIGLYQFNIVVPAVPDSDLVALTFTVGGVASVQTLFTAVQQ